MWVSAVVVVIVVLLLVYLGFGVYEFCVVMVY